MGDPYKVAPLFVDDDDPKTALPWCPACFFNVRARKEPNRWKSIAAVECPDCHWKSMVWGVNFREGIRCPRCNSPRCKIPVSHELANQVTSGG